MKKTSNINRLCLIAALSLLIWQANVCSDSRVNPTASDSCQTDSDSIVTFETPPKFVEKAVPIYPQAARDQCIEGRVIVSVLVCKSGVVGDVKIAKSSGTNVGFEEAAIDAGWRSTFTPAIQNGNPIAVWATYDYRFVVDDDCTPTDSTS